MLAFLFSLILVFFFCPYKCHFKCELRKWAYKKNQTSSLVLIWLISSSKQLLVHLWIMLVMIRLCLSSCWFPQFSDSV